ncbi:outer membrane protein assembly factor BamB family protein [Herbidospora mongoliensis]|uniref:outer membrane protein assembly factor BamB family protein n=1 Tax=Herbidospora mongoliensis TaxID=688067 RepID=UPI00082CE548|nr:PQQ-binding-like beta-propeller repeat protein [Herbidospora mongoliensis]
MRKKFLAVLSVAFLLTGLIATPVWAADYSGQPRAGWLPNGRVLAIVHTGDRVVIAGEFTSLRHSTTGENVGRQRIALLDAASGDLIRTWSPAVNGAVQVLAVGNGRVFLGGDFTTVAGQTRTRLAALDLSTGGVIGGWTPAANSTVRGLAVIGDTLYAGGAFTQVAGQNRTRLAAVDVNSGALRGWNPGANNTIMAMAPAPNGGSVVVGGQFRTLGGATRLFLGSVDLNGTVTGWTPPASCDVASNQCWVLDLAADNDSVYAAIAGVGGRLAAYRLSDGSRRWQRTADGDVESVAVRGSYVYAAGHFCPDFAGFQRCDFAAVDTGTGAVDTDFAPTANGQVFALSAGPDALRAGGGYGQLNGVSRPNYTEFPLIPPSGDVTLIPTGSSWRYLDNGSDQGTAWRATGFNDSGWPQGAAQFGFGDGDERQVIASGRTTYYFRTTFGVASALSQLTMSVIRDDGAIVYVNGNEVWRNNLPGGTITAGSFATSTISGTAESQWTDVTLSPGLLQQGQNTIAVEIHQDRPDSSDVSFDLRLRGR